MLLILKGENAKKKFHFWSHTFVPCRFRIILEINPADMDASFKMWRVAWFKGVNFYGKCPCWLTLLSRSKKYPAPCKGL